MRVVLTRRRICQHYYSAFSLHPELREHVWRFAARSAYALLRVDSFVDALLHLRIAEVHNIAWYAVDRLRARTSQKEAPPGTQLYTKSPGVSDGELVSKFGAVVEERALAVVDDADSSLSLDEIELSPGPAARKRRQSGMSGSPSAPPTSVSLFAVVLVLVAVAVLSAFVADFVEIDFL